MKLYFDGLAAVGLSIYQIANLLILRGNRFDRQNCNFNKINELAIKSDRLLDRMLAER